MFKNNLKIFIIALTSLLSLNINAWEKTCYFPQHFIITGPTNTRIIQVQAIKNSIITAVKTSDTSFDVFDTTDCEEGIRGIELKVGSDNKHKSDMLFVDCPDSLIQVVSLSEFNGFNFKKFQNMNKSNFQIIYEQD